MTIPANPHPAWCQPANCTTTGLDITHRHLIGQIPGTEVWIQRTDTTRPDSSRCYGHTGVYVRADGTQNLTGDLDVLRALLTAAEVFADEVEGVR